jgi:hypothetical protein
MFACCQPLLIERIPQPMLDSNYASMLPYCQVNILACDNDRGGKMTFADMIYQDGNRWLVSPHEMVIGVSQVQGLSALEIGERVLALIPRMQNLARHAGEFWLDRGSGLTTLDEIEEAMATRERQRSLPSQPMPIRRKVTQGAPPAKSSKGFVYIIRGESYYKIGRTEDPYKRLTPMTAHAPFPLETLLLIPTADMVQTEQELHRRFDAKHQRGEWFSLDEEDIAAIRQDYRTLDPSILKAN